MERLCHWSIGLLYLSLTGCVLITQAEKKCEPHRYGPECQHQCSSHCEGGECDSKTGHCQSCDPGYYGDKCEHECNNYCKHGICKKTHEACECESGYYGRDCDQCSKGCNNTCNSDSGRCSCKDGWDGSKCDTDVGKHKIQRYELTFTDETDSSVAVTWRTIKSLPDNIKQYYSYLLGYRVNRGSRWTVVDRKFRHEPEADGTQQYTLTGLQYNTVYDVQVWSVRSLRGLTERTGGTPDAQFTTKCKAPDKPTDMKITHEQDRDKVNLDVTWMAPDPRCKRISDNDIDYRLLANEEEWTNIDLSSSATSARIPDLDPGEYAVRLTVTNNEGLTSSDTKTYAVDYDTNCDNCGDADCVRTAPCQTCRAGYKRPECKQECEAHRYGMNCQNQCSSHCWSSECEKETGRCRCRPGYYGDKCDQECSKRCKDTCNSESGKCNCTDWWEGSKCDTESSGGGSSFPSSAVGIIVCCLIVIIGLIAVIYLLRRGKTPEPNTQPTQKDTSENPYDKPAFNHYVNEEVKPEYT